MKIKKIDIIAAVLTIVIIVLIYFALKQLDNLMTYQRKIEQEKSKPVYIWIDSDNLKRDKR